MIHTCHRQRVQLVGDQDAGCALQQAADAAVQQVAPHVRVHRRQRVVQQHHIRARVAGAREGDPLPLPAAQVDALLADLRLVACNKVSAGSTHLTLILAMRSAVLKPQRQPVTTTHNKHVQHCIYFDRVKSGSERPGTRPM